MAKKASNLFGKINVYPPERGQKRVEIYIRLEQRVENMQTGIAIDASASMMPVFAANVPKLFRQPGANVMEPVVQHLGRYVCDYSGDGKVELIYWAVGTGGSEIESIGQYSAEQCRKIPIDGPKKHAWGTGTRLLPALNHFLEKFIDAEWAILLFITDGALEDFNNVKTRAIQVAQEIIEGKRKQCKFVIVGIGDADEEQLNELDDMFDGTLLADKYGIDLWDCKLASDMDELCEIWDEVDFGITLPGSARIIDSHEVLIQNYSDGIPQRLEFRVDAKENAVSIEIAGQTIKQSLL